MKKTFNQYTLKPSKFMPSLDSIFKEWEKEQCKKLKNFNVVSFNIIFVNKYYIETVIYSYESDE